MNIRVKRKEQESRQPPGRAIGTEAGSFLPVPRGLHGLPSTSCKFSWLLDLLRTVLGNCWGNLHSSPSDGRRPGASLTRS
jgi:hypothetical protein